MSTKLSLEMSQAARDAFRRIRNAAVNGTISAEEMQEYSERVSHAFAKALLSVENPNKLKDEDKIQGVDHVQNLNTYISELLKNEEKLNYAGNPLDNSSIDFILTILSQKAMLKRFGHPESTIVTLLSTGALNLALLSYIHDLKIHYAAVNRDRDIAVISDLPSTENVTIIDDVKGKQISIAAKELTERGHRVKKSDLNGF